MHVKYADNLTVLVPDECVLQDEYNHILEWSNCNGMMLNVQKTKLLRFGSSKKMAPRLQHDSNNSQIELVDAAKLLGITISINFKWSQHVDDVTKQASKRVFIFLQMRRAGCSVRVCLWLKMLSFALFWFTLFQPSAIWALVCLSDCSE